MKVRKDCKTYFITWIITYVIAYITKEVYVIQKAQSFKPSDMRIITATAGCRLLVAVFIAFWSLPLAIITYHSAKGSNKKIQAISGIIVIWLTISLLACIVLLITG